MWQSFNVNNNMSKTQRSEYIICHDLFKQGLLEFNENRIFHFNATKHIRKFLNFFSKQNEKMKTKPKINNFRFVF